VPGIAIARPRFSAQPIFQIKLPHSGELFFIVGYNCVPERKRLGCNEQVVGTNGLAAALKLRAK
jgi:hypothetical protein